MPEDRIPLAQPDRRRGRRGRGDAHQCGQGHIEVFGAGMVAALILRGCGGSGGGSGTPTTTTTTIPAATLGACAVPNVTDSAAPRSDPAVTKAISTGDRSTRRGRVYEELWKHQAARADVDRRRRRSRPGLDEDIGQMAVIRDEGRLVLPANAFDLRAIAVSFARNGAGGYDLRRSIACFRARSARRFRSPTMTAHGWRCRSPSPFTPGAIRKRSSIPMATSPS